MRLRPAKFHVNRCNESPLSGENDFWPLSKNNTGSLPLRGNPAAVTSLHGQLTYNDGSILCIYKAPSVHAEISRFRLDSMNRKHVGNAQVLTVFRFCY